MTLFGYAILALLCAILVSLVAILFKLQDIYVHVYDITTVRTHVHASTDRT